MLKDAESTGEAREIERGRQELRKRSGVALSPSDAACSTWHGMDNDNLVLSSVSAVRGFWAFVLGVADALEARPLMPCMQSCALHSALSSQHRRRGASFS